MSNQFISLISLLGIIATISMAATVAQENDTTLNNISQRNETISGISINLSDINNKSINGTNFDKSSTSNTDPFIITSNATSRPMNGIGLEISAKSLAIQPPKKATFLISGYTRPKIDAIYENTSQLNAAYLSRGVEGTPHGYVTYYN